VAEPAHHCDPGGMRWASSQMAFAIGCDSRAAGDGVDPDEPVIGQMRVFRALSVVTDQTSSWRPAMTTTSSPRGSATSGVFDPAAAVRSATSRAGRRLVVLRGSGRPVHGGRRSRPRPLRGRSHPQRPATAATHHLVASAKRSGTQPRSRGRNAAVREQTAPENLSCATRRSAVPSAWRCQGPPQVGWPRSSGSRTPLRRARRSWSRVARCRRPGRSRACTTITSPAPAYLNAPRNPGRSVVAPDFRSR